jgi:hypothetical protein
VRGLWGVRTEGIFDLTRDGERRIMDGTVAAKQEIKYEKKVS